MLANKKDFNQIDNFKSKLLQTIRTWAVWIFLLLITAIILIDVLPNELKINLTEHPTFSNIIQSVKGLSINFLPILFIAIFIEPLMEHLAKIERLSADSSRRALIREELGPINQRLNNLTTRITSLDGFPEVKYLSCSYTETDWDNLLEDAKHVELSMFYTNTDWNLKNRLCFQRYLQKGGILNLYLPNYAEITSKFMGESHIPSHTSNKILSTMRFFNEMRTSDYENLNIKILQKGFNYMYARITKKDNSRIFIMSPYANNYSKSGSPVLILDESLIKPDMQNFIENELRFLGETSRAVPDYEKSKQVIWRTDRKRVFVSTGLTCPGGCKFCYINSLVEPKLLGNKMDESDIASLCSSICTDPRFEYGREGTTIMLGAFNDPFHSDHFRSSMQIINFFARYGNFVHIAARYLVGENRSQLFSSDKNVVINYSLSSLRQDVELRNQRERFTEAKQLIRSGYRVSLFLRPVIRDVTIRELDEIIRLARDANIREITVGGLYVDDRILKRLKQIGISRNQLSYLEKNFVLDDRSVLKKLQITDLDNLVEKLSAEGFRTFTSSDERIEYYKRNQTNTYED